MRWAIDRLAAPLHVVWEITGRCGQRCKFCYNSSGPDGGATDLTDAELLDVAQQLIRWKVSRVYITGGEPLCRAEVMLELVDMLHAANVNCNLFTDGQQLEEAHVDRIARLFTIVAIGLHGSTASIHDSLCGKDGSFERARTAFGLMKERGARVEAVTVITRDNYADWGNLIEVAANSGAARISAATMVESGRSFEHDLGLTIDERQTFVEDFVQQKMATGDRLKVEVSDPTKVLKAMLAWQPPNTLMHIHFDGTIGVTPWLPLVVGSVRQQPLSELWAGMAGVWKETGVRQLLRNLASVNRLGFEHRRYVDPPLLLANVTGGKEVAQ